MIKQKYKIGQKVFVKKDAISSRKFNYYGSAVYGGVHKVCIIERAHFQTETNDWTYVTDNTNWVHEEFFYVPNNKLGGEIL